jgi:hypothetical protein
MYKLGKVPDKKFLQHYTMRGAKIPLTVIIDSPTMCVGKGPMRVDTVQASVRVENNEYCTSFSTKVLNERICCSGHNLRLRKESRGDSYWYGRSR